MSENTPVQRRGALQRLLDISSAVLALGKAEDASIASQAEMAAYAKAARAIALPQAHHFFAGKIDLETLSFFEQMVVKTIGSPEGDFRDGAAIGAWAQSLVPLFKPTA
jgi:menaquinone-dependent protoporphyrinogen IX oxidase